MCCKTYIYVGGNRIKHAAYTFNSERIALTKSQKPDSIVLKIVTLGRDLAGVNTFRPRWWHLISIFSGIIIVSPSRCIIPLLSRSIVSEGVRNDMMFVSWSICLEKSSIPSIAVSNGVIGNITVTSIRPSCMSAFGAMYALLPYWEALPHAIMKAFSAIVPSGLVMRYDWGRYLRYSDTALFT